MMSESTAVRRHVLAMTDDPRVDEAAAWIEGHLDDPKAFSAAVDVGEVIDKARAR